MGLLPPATPTFIPGIPIGTVAAELNTKVRDPLQFLIDRPRARWRRTTAFNLTEGVTQYIPWVTADEDYIPGGGNGWSVGSVVGGGGSSTLNGATVAGATTVTLVSAANFAIDDFVRIDTLANQEYRRITNVAGAVLTLEKGLSLAHSSGVAATEVTADASRYVCQAAGWYLATARMSISGTGAAGLTVIPVCAVNGTSHTGFGGSGWEGTEAFVPTGASTQPKVGVGTWTVYMNVGDYAQFGLFYSTESAITAVDTTSGVECGAELVWDGV